MAQVSVLLPNYNNGPYLKECLDSLFSQTFTDFVIYLVDDCSTDNSLEVARSYSDSRLKIIEKKKNSGIVDTMNVALDLIDTKYFIRMDGDDISTPDRFEILVSYMEHNPEIGVCSSDIVVFGDYDEILEFGRDAEMNKANLLFGHSIGHASSIFRTDVLKNNDIRYEDVYWRMEDYLLFYKLKDYTNTISIPKLLYRYRKAAHNTAPEIHQRKLGEFRRFYQMVFNELGMKKTDESIELHLEISKRKELSHSYIQYKRHLADLIRANSESQLFPPAALKKVLKKYSDILVFRLIDRKAISFITLIPYFFRVKGLLRHYMKKKLNRLKK